MNSTHLNPLSDTNQSWWELVAIQFSSWMGIPILASSILILQKNSFLGAMLTIVVGNAIMWFVRLGIIAMSHENRQSTLDVSRAYLGKIGGYFISLLLLISTFAWYITETTIGGEHLTALLAIHESPKINQFAQVSVLLGIISAFLCMEGISLLKKISLFSFPFLFVSFFIILFSIPKNSIHSQIQTVSLSGLSIFLATNLGISSDLPTFFRHGQSWAESIQALTIIQILNVLFGILSLYFGSLVINGLEINSSVALSEGNSLLRWALIVFIFLSVICANVANVYSASVGWEIVAPAALVGRKEYLILGLSLAILFILVSNMLPIDLLLNITDAGLVNLCLILTVGYVFSKKLKKPPCLYLKTMYFLAWLISTGGNIIQISHEEMFSPLAYSLIVIFIFVGISVIGLKFIKPACK